MILVMITIILVLVIAIAHLCFDIHDQRKTFENRIDVLEDIITTLQEKQSTQLNQLKLSDALSKQLKESNHVLSETIFDVNVDLFAVSFNKKDT